MGQHEEKMEKEREVIPSWDLPWGGLRTVSQNLSSRGAFMNHCCLPRKAAVFSSWVPCWGGNRILERRWHCLGRHSAYKASQTPMLPKASLCWEQSLINLEQPSREFPICLSPYTSVCLVKTDERSYRNVGGGLMKKRGIEKLFNKATGERIPHVPTSGWRRSRKSWDRQRAVYAAFESNQFPAGMLALNASTTGWAWSAVFMVWAPVDCSLESHLLIGFLAVSKT